MKIRECTRFHALLLVLALCAWPLLAPGTAQAGTATLSAPTNGSSAYPNQVRFTWNAVTGADSYYLYGGTSVGANNVINFGETQATTFSRSNLPAGTLYVRLWTKTGATAPYTWTYSDTTLTVLAAPQATLLTPAQGATVYSNAVKLSWAAVSGAEVYYLYVGTTLGAKDVVNTGETTQTQFSRGTLPAGTLYARLWTKSAGAGWVYSDSTFNVLPAPQATLLAPLNGNTVFSSNVAFSWLPVASAEDYYLYVGSTPGAKDVINSGVTTARSYAATLPNGTYYARLWTQSAVSAWQYTDSTFTVAAAGANTLSGTISGLTGSGLVLEAIGNNDLAVPANATSFTFPNALPLNTEYDVAIAQQPTSPAQTCIATTAHGFASASISNVVVTCVNNSTDPLQGVYQQYKNGVATQHWIAFYPDGVYLFATLDNKPSCNTATNTNNGNGTEFGAYNWNSATGSFQFLNTLVDSNGSCGIATDGAIHSDTLTLTKTGTGQSTLLTLLSADSPGVTLTFVPVLSPRDQIIGGFTTDNTEQGFGAIFGDGHVLIASTQTDIPSDTLAGLEYSCYTTTGTTSGNLTWDLSTATCPAAVDTNGTAGLSNGADPIPYTILNANEWLFGGSTIINRFTPP